MDEDKIYHIPVLLHESVDALMSAADGVYVDVTFGGGGHSREVLRRLNEQGRLFAFDQDADAVANVPFDDKRLTFVQSNFRYLRNWMRFYEVDEVDGVLADLGVSSHHFDEAMRGFSFRQDGPLDMRMNRSARLTAADLVNTYDEEKLASLFYLYGELSNGRALAAALCRARKAKRVVTTTDFVEVITPLLGRNREKKDLAKAFQALRMEVNHEMDALCEMLGAAIHVLKPGGRLVVLTYHSLEDRIVKNFMRSGNAEGVAPTDFYGNRISPLRPVAGKAVQPSFEEETRNPRSRSAKLRVAERVALPDND